MTPMFCRTVCVFFFKSIFELHYIYIILNYFSIFLLKLFSAFSNSFFLFLKILSFWQFLFNCFYLLFYINTTFILIILLLLIMLT